MSVVPFPEKEYALTEAQVLLLTMRAEHSDSPKVAAMREEMIKVIMAWRRGKLLPRSEAPLVTAMLVEFFGLE